MFFFFCHFCYGSLIGEDKVKNMEERMRGLWWSTMAVAVFLLVNTNTVNGEDPYQFFTWNITYGDIYPLGVKQQV